MTPIDVEWYDAHPYPPAGWSLALVRWRLVRRRLARIGYGESDRAVVVARRGPDEIVWSQVSGVARLLDAPGVEGSVSPHWAEVDPCITETLRLYALGLRRAVAEEGER